MEFRYNYCIKHCALCVTNNLLILWAMIHILSWTTKKHQKTLSRPLHSKLEETQGLFKDLHRNLRAFYGKMEFKDFSRLCKPWISSMKSIHWQLEGIKSANLKFQFLLYIFAASHLAFVKRTNARFDWNDGHWWGHRFALVCLSTWKIK